MSSVPQVTPAEKPRQRAFQAFRPEFEQTAGIERERASARDLGRSGPVRTALEPACQGRFSASAEHVRPTVESERPTAGRPTAPRLGHWLRLLLIALPVWFALLGGARAAEFLDPEQAFRTELVRANEVELVFRATAADGYYLYRERFGVDAEAKGVRFGALSMPPGKVKHDPNFDHDVETYRGAVEIRVPIEAAPAEFVARLSLQGCADAGLCYSPMQAEFPVRLAGAVATRAVADQTAAHPATGPAGTARPAAVASGKVTGTVRTAAARSTKDVAPARTASAGAGGLDDEMSRIRQTLASGSLLQVAPVFFVLGLLLSFTPCVLPMVPILSSIIVGQQQPVTRGRGFALAFAYSIGMAMVYTGVGVAAGLAGEGLAAALQKPWVLALFASLLVGLALSMFDLYQLEMPQFIQQRANAASSRMPGGRFAGVFVMGAVSALVVGPCVAAPLAGALVYISQTRDVVLGGGALFAMAMGMSVPLLLIGMSAGSLIPRTGMWMVAIKRFFGVLLIGVAIWLVSPALPDWAVMLAWATLFIVTASYLSVFDPLPADAGGWQRLWKGVGALLLALGAVQVVGVASGGRQLLQPLAALAAKPAVAGTAVVSARPEFQKVTGLAELERVLGNAKGPVMIDVSADWCVSCKEMESITFADPAVARRMRDFRLVKVDVTANSPADKALLKRFGLFGPPGILFFHRGVEREDARVIGYQAPAPFAQRLARLLES